MEVTQNGVPLRLTKPSETAPVSATVPEKVQSAVAALRQAAKGDKIPDGLTQADALAASLLAGRTLRENLKEAALPTTAAEIQSEAQVAQAAAALTKAEALRTSRLLSHLEEKKMISAAAQSVLESYRSLSAALQQAYSLKTATSDSDGNVTVETWASPAALRVDGVAVAATRVDAARAQITFKAEPGASINLSLAGTPIQLADAAPLPVTVRRQNPVTVAIAQKGKLHDMPLTGTRIASCRIREGKKDGLTYKWQVLVNNKDLVPPKEASAENTFAIDPPMLKQIADAGGSAQLVAEVYRNGKLVASDTDDNLTVVKPQGMAFIVGIEDYPGAELAWLTSDADEFAKRLIGSFGYQRENVCLVTAPKGKILVNDQEQTGKVSDVLSEAFNDFLERAKRIGATHFIIYFSGHGEANNGQQNSLYKGRDELELPDKSTIWEHEWAEKILDGMKENIPIDKLTVIGLYQACRPGANMGSDDAIFKTDVKKSARYYALQSCAPGSLSYDDALPTDAKNYIGINHGYFGKALLDALELTAKNGEKALTVDKLYGRVDTKLSEITGTATQKTGNPHKQDLPDKGSNANLPAIYARE